VLNFTDEVQKAMDEIVVFSNETFIEFINTGIKSKNEINLKQVKERHAFKYFELGIFLINGGVVPALLDVIMQNAYELIIGCFDSKDTIDVLRLQLLFVKKAISLLHQGNLTDYIYFLIKWLRRI